MRNNLFTQIAKMLFVVVVITVTSFSNANAQNDKLGSWAIANVTAPLNKKFALFVELQERSQKLTNDYFYHEFKGGLFYYFKEKNSVFIGTGDYRTYAFPGNFKNRTVREHRIWEQITLNNNIGRVKMEHRYRIEQRWLNGKFANRLRYRINPILPINRSSLESNTLYLTVNDEVFFTDKSPYFLRNRFFGGIGYRFNTHFTIQGGVLRQFDYRKSDDGTGKNFAHLSLLFTTGQLLKNRLPSTMD